MQLQSYKPTTLTTTCYTRLKRAVEKAAKLQSFKIPKKSQKRRQNREHAFLSMVGKPSKKSSALTIGPCVKCNTTIWTRTCRLEPKACKYAASKEPCYDDYGASEGRRLAGKQPKEVSKFTMARKQDATCGVGSALGLESSRSNSCSFRHER